MGIYSGRMARGRTASIWSIAPAAALLCGITCATPGGTAHAQNCSANTVLVPVNTAALDASLLKSSLNAMQQKGVRPQWADPTIPPLELPISHFANADMFTSVLTAAQAAKLGYGFFTSQGQRTNLVFVQEYCVYNNLVINPGSTYFALQYGVGLRVVVTISSRDKSVDVSSLPLIAAAVSSKRASATARFQILGFIGQKASDLVPAPMELTASTLVTMNDAFNKIKILLYNPEGAQTPPDPTTVMVKPQLLRLTVPCHELGK